MPGNLADVKCKSCGAPAKFDVIKQRYHCAFCGNDVEISDSLEQKRGFRNMIKEKINESVKEFNLIKASCSSCGAEIVLEGGEAVANCSFCGKSLVRKDYIHSGEMPEMIIPFRITEAEAKERLFKWCKKNSEKIEAKKISEKIEELKGFYLPYELIKGPVTSTVSRMEDYGSYDLEGYIDNVFVNTSKQLDNRLLDGIEPYELQDLKEFDFAYTAGHRIKVSDVDNEELESRINSEISNDYAPTIRKTLETNAVFIDTSPKDVLRMPVLLPVYFLNFGDTEAAVNGQTGKVSVLSEKEKYYYFLPWWLKAILSTIVLGGLTFGAFMFFKNGFDQSLFFSGILTGFYLIVTLALFSDTPSNNFRERADYEVFTSQGSVKRINGKLVEDKKQIKKEVIPPVFFMDVEGEEQAVVLKFSSVKRSLLIAITAITVLFLPVIVALFFNGFDFQRLNLAGSAVWFCIFIPVIPIYILKFGRVYLYERPWIYTIDKAGKFKRYRENKIPVGEIIKTGVQLLFIPPLCFATWFAIASFCTMVYLTAFGFD